MRKTRIDSQNDDIISGVGLYIEQRLAYREHHRLSECHGWHMSRHDR